MAGPPAAPPIRILLERGRTFVARQARPALRWRRLPRLRDTGRSASAQWFALLRLTCAVMVGLPTVLTVLYILLFASPVYVSEARLAIREAIPERAVSQQAGAEAQGGIVQRVSNLLGGAGEAAQSEAPFIFVSYVTSRSYVASLDEGGWLRGFFSRPGIDPISALSSHATLEAVWRYWERHVTAAVDRRSSIVILRVSAFSAEDAHTLASRVVADGEHLLNDIVMRARADSVAHAREEVERASRRYEAALRNQQEWRARQRAVDPAQAAEAVGASLLRLEYERIAADRQMRALERLSAPGGPALGVLRDRVAAIDKEIAAFKARLAEPGARASVVAALASYEEAELEVRFAETLQAVAVAGLQEAERRAREQSAFVNVFVPPSLPTAAAGPLWWRGGLFVLALSGILWINAMVLVAVIRDHRR
ncbi:hypothetical protein V5F44_07225 [Xanthobacter sp. V2C-8]|uniref:hypothetical protein n=1 Tax=Xanthobacter albus TaxID=3119929 RepID=UPI00372B743A